MRVLYVFLGFPLVALLLFIIPFVSPFVALYMCYSRFLDYKEVKDGLQPKERPGINAWMKNYKSLQEYDRNKATSRS